MLQQKTASTWELDRVMFSFQCDQKEKWPREESGSHTVTESDATTRTSGPVLFILLPF